MKVQQYVYRLDCGDIHPGPEGLAEATGIDCPLHGQATVAGPGISLFRFLNPDYAPELASPAVIQPRPAPRARGGIPGPREATP